MTIHHKTKAKAETRSINLHETPNGVNAVWVDHEEKSIEIEAVDAKTALGLMVEQQSDYIDQAADEAEADLISVAIFGEPEPEAVGTIVPVKYRKRYQENGNPRGNGDPFFHFMNEQTLDQEGKCILSALFEIAMHNGIDAAKYAKLNNGQQRMNVGNRMRNQVLAGQDLFDVDGKKVKITKEWKEWIEAKAEEKAQKAAAAAELKAKKAA